MPPGAVATVRIIDSTTSIKKLPTKFLMTPPMHGMEFMPDIPTWSFLVESDTGKKALFDLGVPPNWKDFSPVVTNRLLESGWEISAHKHVEEILRDHQVDPVDINSVVWRWVSNVLPRRIDGWLTRFSISATGIGTISAIHRLFP